MICIFNRGDFCKKTGENTARRHVWKVTALRTSWPPAVQEHTRTKICVLLDFWGKFGYAFELFAFCACIRIELLRIRMRWRETELMGPPKCKEWKYERPSLCRTRSRKRQDLKVQGTPEGLKQIKRQRKGVSFRQTLQRSSPWEQLWCLYRARAVKCGNRRRAFPISSFREISSSCFSFFVTFLIKKWGKRERATGCMLAIAWGAPGWIKQTSGFVGDLVQPHK